MTFRSQAVILSFCPAGMKTSVPNVNFDIKQMQKKQQLTGNFWAFFPRTAKKNKLLTGPGLEPWTSGSAYRRSPP